MSLLYCLTLKKWGFNMRETKFKQTDIGLYPVDWDCIALSDKCKTSSGGTPSRVINAYWTNGNIKWVTTGELRDCAIEDTIEHITDLGLQNSSAKIFPNGTLLIAMYGATIGKLGLLNTAAATNQACCAIIPNEEVDTLFLYYYLLSKRTHIMALGSGAGQPNISQNIIRALTIPLPPLAEQRKIAKALSDVDGLISSLAKLIEKKQNIKTATMQQLLTGKKRLEGFTEPWVEKEIGKLGKSYSGLTGKSAKDFGHGTAKYITFLNVLNNPKIDTSIFENVDVSEGESQNPVRKGDLLFNTSSETPEEVGICSAMLNNIDRLYLNSFCFGFRPNECVDSLFMSYWFRSSEGRNLMSTLAQGSTRYNLSKENMMKSTILIPKKDEQTAIAKILDLMDNEISALETKKAKYESIKKGMMQELLTGRIRLV